jgi:hypothetical protein
MRARLGLKLPCLEISRCGWPKLGGTSPHDQRPQLKDKGYLVINAK